MNDDILVSNKYMVFYRTNEVIFGEIFTRWKTNFTLRDGKHLYNFPAYNTHEEAIQELERYNKCKLEKCNNE